jgi:phospholipid/cholesterol/gamma-HCH transport system permease protein
MVEIVRQLGAASLKRLQTMGAASLFLWQTLVAVPQPKRSFLLLIRQLYAVGVMSLPIILVSAYLLDWY